MAMAMLVMEGLKVMVRQEVVIVEEALAVVELEVMEVGQKGVSVEAGMEEVVLEVRVEEVLEEASMVEEIEVVHLVEEEVREVVQTVREVDEWVKEAESVERIRNNFAPHH